MKRIAIEEHFFSGELLNYLRSRKDYPRLETIEGENHKKIERVVISPSRSEVLLSGHMSSMLDIGSGRLADMDRDGIDMQVLMLGGPSVEAFDIATVKIREEDRRLLKNNRRCCVKFLF